MRVKIPDLALALEGRFGDHHALMGRLHLDHIGHLEEMIAKLDAQVEVMMTPFRSQRDLLTTIPGIGRLAAAAVISEIGTDVTGYFPDAAHLASWAGLCPGNHESAGKRRSGKRRQGSQHLQPTAHSSSGNDTLKYKGFDIHRCALYCRRFVPIVEVACRIYPGEHAYEDIHDALRQIVLGLPGQTNFNDRLAQPCEGSFIHSLS
jgi:hypothetical protein